MVWVPEPMVAVATGQTASLACLVNENASNQRVYWLDYKGAVIVNNSGSNSIFTDHGDNHGGQQYTINMGPVFVTSYNYDRERSTSSFRGQSHNIAGADIVESPNSAIVITTAIDYKNRVSDENFAAGGKANRKLRNAASYGDSSFRADENPDTRDPFLVMAIKKIYY